MFGTTAWEFSCFPAVAADQMSLMTEPLIRKDTAEKRDRRLRKNPGKHDAAACHDSCLKEKNISLFARRLVFAVILMAFSPVVVLADCPSADLNSDCVVDLADLAVFGSQWLDVPGGSADLDGIVGVSLGDFAVLAAHWRTRGQRVINEFMTDNKGFFFDAFGDDDDWIEIYNYGTEPIDTGGMFLTDELTEVSPHRIPSGVPEQTTIPGGGYLVLWADGEPGEGALHLGFKLAAGGGEDIALFDSAGRLVDCVADFGPQAENTSWGRMPDAGDQWQAFGAGTATPPTPGQSNGGILPEDGILITEIMYHPYNSAHPLVEDIREEYIELHNRGFSEVDLDGWRITDGVDYTFGEVIIGPGEYLAVAADVVTFAAKYPGVSNVVGGWVGRLSNSGETIELTTAVGKVIDRISYADEGDWAQRVKGPLDHGHRGWEWSNAHDGGGYSLELVNANRPNEYGQNWAASAAAGGTPGAVNGVVVVENAPFIVDVKHFPIIPSDSDTVSVSARIIAESTIGLTRISHR